MSKLRKRAGLVGLGRGSGCRAQGLSEVCLVQEESTIGSISLQSTQIAAGRYPWLKVGASTLLPSQLQQARARAHFLVDRCTSDSMGACAC